MTRGSSLILNRPPPASFWITSSAFWASAPSTMVRNLNISNGTPSRPMRRWRKSTGPGESSLIAIAIAASTGDSTTNSSPAPTRSKVRFSAREERPRP